MFDIITIGTALVDAFVKSKAFTLIKSNQFSTGVGECFAFGSKVEVDHLALTTGGGASNTAVAFARLGLKTASVAKIGQDFLADMVRTDLLRENVDIKFLLSCPKDHTGMSVILLGQEGERTILVYRGASEHCHHVKPNLSKLRAKWFYISSLGGDVKLFKQILALAKKQDSKVAWNPGSLELQHGWNILAPLISSCEVVFLNQEEAKLATKSDDFLNIFSKLETTVIVTNGPAGADVLLGNKHWQVRATGVKAINRTGAGDAFASGVVAGLVKKMSLIDSLKLGVANAENVIKHIGAKTGLVRKLPLLHMKKVKVSLLK